MARKYQPTKYRFTGKVSPDGEVEFEAVVDPARPPRTDGWTWPVITMAQEKETAWDSVRSEMERVAQDPMPPGTAYEDGALAAALAASIAARGDTRAPANALRFEAVTDEAKVHFSDPTSAKSVVRNFEDTRWHKEEFAKADNAAHARAHRGFAPGALDAALAQIAAQGPWWRFTEELTPEGGARFIDMARQGSGTSWQDWRRVTLNQEGLRREMARLAALPDSPGHRFSSRNLARALEAVIEARGDEHAPANALRFLDVDGFGLARFVDPMDGSRVMMYAPTVQWHKDEFSKPDNAFHASVNRPFAPGALDEALESLAAPPSAPAPLAAKIEAMRSAAAKEGEAPKPGPAAP